jgi:DNA-binding MarR family transcriptional regulator
MRRITFQIASIIFLLFIIIINSSVSAVEIETDKETYHPNESIAFHVEEIDDSVTLQINKNEEVMLIFLIVPENGSISYNFTIPSDWIGEYNVWISNEMVYDTHEITVIDQAAPFNNTDNGPQKIPLAYPIIGVGVVVVFLMGGVFGTTEAGRFQAMMFFTPLFTRLREDDILNQETRWKILGAVYAQPGITYSELKRKLNLNNGTLIHHTDILIKDNRIITRLDGSRRRYFSISMEKRTASIFPGPTINKSQIEILAYIEEYPGYTQKHISRGMGISQSKLSYNLQKLEEMGYIEVLRDKKKRYFLRGGPQSFTCPNCHNQFSSELKPKFCPGCGMNIHKSQHVKVDTFVKKGKI